MKDYPKEIKVAVDILQQLKDLSLSSFEKEALELLYNLYVGDLEKIYEHRVVKDAFNVDGFIETNSIMYENDLYFYELEAMENGRFWINFKDKITGSESYWDNDAYIYGLMEHDNTSLSLLSEDIKEYGERLRFIAFLNKAKEKGYIS